MSEAKAVYVNGVEVGTGRAQRAKHDIGEFEVRVTPSTDFAKKT